MFTEADVHPKVVLKFVLNPDQIALKSALYQPSISEWRAIDKIGKFGLTINTSYSITDLPMIYSGSSKEVRIVPTLGCVQEVAALLAHAREYSRDGHDRCFTRVARTKSSNRP